MGPGGAARRHVPSGAFFLGRPVPADAEPPADLEAQAGDAGHATADGVGATLDRVDARRVAFARTDGSGLTLARTDRSRITLARTD
ncbi:hypothetical protein, partial [Streptomyces sp. NPDC003522]